MGKNTQHKKHRKIKQKKKWAKEGGRGGYTVTSKASPTAPWAARERGPDAEVDLLPGVHRVGGEGVRLAEGVDRPLDVPRRDGREVGPQHLQPGSTPAAAPPAATRPTAARAIGGAGGAWGAWGGGRPSPSGKTRGRGAGSAKWAGHLERATCDGVPLGTPGSNGRRGQGSLLGTPG